MPIYEYKCLDCGELMEVIHKINEGYPRTCRKCGGTLEKKISAPAIQFKGSGWYITDYARAGNSTNNSGAASKSKETKDEKSKPEKKAEAKSSTSN